MEGSYTAILNITLFFKVQVFHYIAASHKDTLLYFLAASPSSPQTHKATNMHLDILKLRHSFNSLFQQSHSWKHTDIDDFDFPVRPSR